MTTIAQKEFKTERKENTVSLTDHGLKVGKVSKLLQFNKSAIGKGYKQYQETGSVESRSRSGKPQNFTARCMMALSKKKGEDILPEIFNK